MHMRSVKRFILVVRINPKVQFHHVTHQVFTPSEALLAAVADSPRRGLV